jgi:hypothetical protein
MPMLKWLVSCLGVSILVVHFADVEQRSAELQRFLIDKNDGASQIISRYGMTNEQCPQIRAGDVYRLALAFVTVESFATPYVESRTRGLVVEGANLVGVPIPDISIGPGRIRLDTARAALMRSVSLDLRPYKNLNDAELAEKLLERCYAAKVAALILEDVIRDTGRTSDALDLRLIRIAAKRYNGQSDRPRSLDGAISAAIYFDLIYEIFQHYRFG